MMRWDAAPDGETPLLPDAKEGLRDPGIRTLQQLSVAELRNNHAAATKYLASRPNKRTAPFTFEWMLELHREMFGDVWEWAGTIRPRELNIGSPPFAIAQHLAELAEDAGHWATSRGDVIEEAMQLHFRTVKIHPFFNGNGRWSRLLADIWLRQRRRRPVNWPRDLATEASEVRSEYLRCIRLADTGNTMPLYDLIFFWTAPHK